ncbi:MAG TPA: DUF5683 domain-containing protein [Bacteroidia bacterium]|jgi:hypothetical protein|nr:DUF5683 domain-containing protein [Bacteroidia bacterium]
MHKKEKYGFNKTRFYIFVLCAVLFIVKVQAQVGDTAKIMSTKDTVILKKAVVYHSPRKAALYSTVLPGLGQAYNKKYWKIPVLYCAAGGLAYSIIYWQRTYIEFRTAYRIRVDTVSTTFDEFVGVYNDAQLLSATQIAHRYRDLSVFGTVLLYVLNIVDASVDAHLYNFDVSDNLSLNIQPTFITTVGLNSPRTNITGVSLHLTF